MNDCDVCCEKLNKINHKKVECPFCDLTCCRSCSQRYILSTFEDPHCMGCKTLWNREFIDSFCTKYFRNTELKRHRENVLFEREKALMPQSQKEVERILAIRKLRREARTLRIALLDAYHKYELSFPITSQNISNFPEVLAFHHNLETIYIQLERLRNMGELYVDEPTKFIRKCPQEECKGFLNEEYFCGLCQNNFCKDCNELLKEGHVCDPQVVKTMKLLNKDSKSCPKCGTVIHKTSGCSQMWCINCHTAFDWRSGEIVTGRIHNPHFIEFKKKGGVSREHGDIPCGGIPTYRELREVQASNDILNLATGIYYADREHMFMDVEPVNNLSERVAYMLNEFKEREFKVFLQRQEKYKDKVRDLSNIFEMLTHSGGDILRQFILEPDRETEFIDILRKLFNYGNEVFATIRERYKCVTPRNFYL
jgi:hypothetical protein|tara:strand:+ start:168 stop:1439 length:1272 start_codon:yes stop_codon:yes gene_type:complete